MKLSLKTVAGLGFLVITLVYFYMSVQGRSQIKLTFIDDWNESSAAIWGRGAQTPGQLSGLFYDESSRKYIAVSDDRFDLNQPQWSRDHTALYYLDLPIQSDGETEEMAVSMAKPVEFVYLKKEEEFVPFEFGDMEGVVALPNGNLALAGEGNVKPQKIKTERGERDTYVAGPHIDEYTRQGEFVKSYSIPPYYNPKLATPADTVPISGVAHGFAFEGLTLTGGNIFAVTEGGLVQDGGPATLDHGAWARLLQLSAVEDTFAPVHEFVIPIDKIPVPDEWLGEAPAVAGDNGISEIIALDAQRFLVLERAFVKAPHFRNHIRLYLVDTTGATDTLGQEKLPQDVVPAKKELLLDFESILPLLEPNQVKGLDHGTLENYEGMALTTLPDGTQGILLLCDNNNNVRNQRQSILLFRIEGL